MIYMVQNNIVQNREFHVQNKDDSKDKQRMLHNTSILKGKR